MEERRNRASPAAPFGPVDGHRAVDHVALVARWSLVAGWPGKGCPVSVPFLGLVGLNSFLMVKAYQQAITE